MMIIMIRDKKLERIGKLIYEGWEHRPNIPPFIKGTPYAYAWEGVEHVIGAQLEIGKNMAKGQYKAVDFYSPVERDRAASIGTKFIWSPGGFQI